MMKPFAVVAAFALFVPAAFPAGDSLGRTHSSIERMAPERLEAAHADVLRYQSQRRELRPIPGYSDFRAILHAHAEDSDHTGGTRPEMLEDAKRAGVDVIMLTDHFRPPRDYMDSWRGMHDGVLFIPGSEAKGFLLYPDHSIMDAMEAPAEQLIAETTKGDGLIFLSHVEERMEHSMEGLDGMEIYNRHADAKDDPEVLFSIAVWATDPAEIPKLQDAIAAYPDEVLASQLDYPADYLAKWDKETAARRLTGVAANDCHHNQVFVVKMVDENTIIIGTIVDKDEDMQKMAAAQRPGIPELTKGHQPGDTLVSLDFDPYVRSFRNVSTHILAPELTEKAIRDALAAGHAYVSHDWMCDPTGFTFVARTRLGDQPLDNTAAARMAIMGDEVRQADGPEFFSEFPIPCDIRLLKNGEEVARNFGNALHHTPDGPGVYRIEGWLKVDGEDRVWIYSNPIYVR